MGSWLRGIHRIQFSLLILSDIVIVMDWIHWQLGGQCNVRAHGTSITLICFARFRKDEWKIWPNLCQAGVSGNAFWIFGNGNGNCLSHFHILGTGMINRIPNFCEREQNGNFHSRLLEKGMRYCYSQFNKEWLEKKTNNVGPTFTILDALKLKM